MIHQESGQCFFFFFLPTNVVAQPPVIKEMTELAISRLRSRLWMKRQWVLALATTGEAQ